MKINSYSNVIKANYQNSPANLPIAEKMTSQEKGLEQGVENTEDGNNLINVADSSLDNVSESLTRIKELSVQASNGTLTNDDKSIIQNEIDSLKNDISDTLENTEFNTNDLFNGFDGNIQTGANENQGENLTIENTSLDTLGIENYDVTSDFNIEQIDEAINMVNEQRSDLGAQQNGFTRNINSNQIARENVLSAKNSLDEDVESKIMELKQSQILDTYKNAMQVKEMDQEKDKNSVLNGLL
ncbi:MAG: flagellin [Bacillota bacterium]